MRCSTAVFVIVCGVPSCLSAAPADTPRLDVVKEFIRELAASERIRAAGEAEIKDTGDGDKFAAAIHISTRTQLELRSEISMLKAMHLSAPNEQLLPTLAGFYGFKVEAHQKLIDICSEFIGGAKEGVDYGKLAAEVPKSRAGIEYIDEAIFQSTPLLFALLIDDRADSKNHANHLRINREQRTDLVDTLNSNFGEKLNAAKMPYLVTAAASLRSLLLSFKCSDDPWE